MPVPAFVWLAEWHDDEMRQSDSDLLVATRAAVGLGRGVRLDLHQLRTLTGERIGDEIGPIARASCRSHLALSLTTRPIGARRSSRRSPIDARAFLGVDLTGEQGIEDLEGLAGQRSRDGGKGQRVDGGDRLYPAHRRGEEGLLDALWAKCLDAEVGFFGDALFQQQVPRRAGKAARLERWGEKRPVSGVKDVGSRPLTELSGGVGEDRVYAGTYVRPLLGKKRIRDLTPEMVLAWQRKLLTEGGGKRNKVLAPNTNPTRPLATCRCVSDLEQDSIHSVHKLDDIVQFVNRSPIPPLLPILRSKQQGVLLAWILEQPVREASETDLARLLEIPRPTVHREVESALRAGILRARRVGRTKLVSANPESAYLQPLRELLMRSFGVPFQLAATLKHVPGIGAAFVFGSWAARFNGVEGQRPVGDIDLLVLGEPDESMLYDAVLAAKDRLGYEVQVTIRPPDWIACGTGSFHDTVLSRPKVQIDIGGIDESQIDLATSMASVAHR